MCLKRFSDAVELRSISADETVALRHAVLWPDHPISHVRLSEDDLGFHYGAFLPSHDAPVAVISVFRDPLPMKSIEDQESDSGRTVTAARFRKFACDPAYQGRGIGTKLLQYVFRMAREELGCDVVWCDARLSTAGWYERRGMSRFGVTFFKEHIEYVRMRGPSAQVVS